MKIAKPTSAHFRERARHYRLAEAIADAPRDVEMFHDLATMFERLSEDFARMVHGRSGASALDGVRVLRTADTMGRDRRRLRLHRLAR